MEEKTKGAAQAPPERSAKPAQRRALAPDLARGTALLGIALANSIYYIGADQYTVRSRPVDGSALDSVVDLVLVTLVDARWLPLFALLFGYGAVQLAQRQAAAGVGWAQVRGLQRRRFAWLTVFGAAHVLLLFGGDILSIYGLLGLLLVFLLGATDRLLLTLAALALVFAVPLGALVSMPPIDSGARISVPSLLVDDHLQALVLRVTHWPLDFAVLALSALAPMLLGVWAARRRLLDEPWRHVDLLSRTAKVCLPLSVLGGLPLGLITAELWDPGFGTMAFTTLLHTLTGFAGALGAGAVFGLLSARERERRGPITRALVATGRRSLSCYLAQSVFLVFLFTPFMGGLGDGMGTAAMAASAVAIWLTTVVLAAVADRFGRQGPAEALLRRLTRPQVPKKTVAA